MTTKYMYLKIKGESHRTLRTVQITLSIIILLIVEVILFSIV